MRKKLLILLLFFVVTVNAQVPIFSATMSVSATGSVSSPTAEQVSKIIDGNVNTKFLDFNDDDGFGFIVNTATSPTVATRIDITTANDSPERDPMNYEVAGSTNGTAYTVITSGTIPCVATRFFTRSFNFTNTAGYTYYRVNFTSQCNTIEQMLQLAEVQLLGTVLSTNDFSLNSNNVVLFPNPAHGNFTLENTNSEIISKVSIVDVLGKTVKDEVYADMNNQKTIDVSQFTSGLYFVKVFYNDKAIVKQLIVN